MKPTEHKTAQAPIFAYAQEIGRTLMSSREEAEEGRAGSQNETETQRGAGFLTRDEYGKNGQECPFPFESNHGQECPCPLSEGPPFYNKYAEKDAHRRNLPHWQQGHVWCFVTWRLADSLPKAKLEQWNTERNDWLRQHPEPWDAEIETAYHEKFSCQIDEWLDQGSGSCVLKDPVNATIVADALKHFDEDRYEIASFVVMPNHVHVLFRPLGENALADIVKSWKGFSAREINKRIGKTGELWQDEYWDRLIRNERHFFKVGEYIRENPTGTGARVFRPVVERGKNGQECPFPCFGE